MDNHGFPANTYNPFVIPGMNPFPEDIIPSDLIDPNRGTNFLTNAQSYMEMYVERPIPMPYHTSALTGEQYAAELMSGHPGRFITMARMSKEAFTRLCKSLRDNRLLVDNPNAHVYVEQSVLLWLYTMVYNSRQRQTADRYQHSTDTIHRHVRRVTYALCALGRSVIRRYNNHPHARLLGGRFDPFFKNCVGAMDGTFIKSILPAEMHMAARHRSGAIGHTLMAVCDFDMVYTFVNAGWEASAHDGRIFNEIANPLEKFPFPGEAGRRIGGAGNTQMLVCDMDTIFELCHLGCCTNKEDGSNFNQNVYITSQLLVGDKVADEFILVDSAFPNVKGFLAPIPGEPYQRSDFEGRQVESYRQLFNLRHSSLRNVVERAFGVLKGRFAILTQMPRYEPQFQSAIVIACVTMHNYIRIYGGDGNDLFEDEFQGDNEPMPEPQNDPDTEIDQSPATLAYYYQKREQIAKAMWGDACARNEFF